MTATDFISMLAGAALLGAALLAYRRLQGPARLLAAGVVLGMALLLGTHHWPGFPRWVLAAGQSLSSCSLPWYWTLHIDKLLAGLLVWAGMRRVRLRFDQPDAIRCGLACVLGSGLVLGLAVLLGHIRWYPSAPPVWPAWILANLLLTVVAEEVLFRGFLQGELERAWASLRHGALAALGVSALAFGVAHAGGGWTYVLLATLAGLLYSLLWQKTQSLVWPIATHGLLNACHFLFFTYPAWNGTACP